MTNHIDKLDSQSAAWNEFDVAFEAIKDSNLDEKESHIRISNALTRAMNVDLVHKIYTLYNQKNDNI